MTFCGRPFNDFSQEGRRRHAGGDGKRLHGNVLRGAQGRAVQFHGQQAKHPHAVFQLGVLLIKFIRRKV